MQGTGLRDAGRAEMTSGNPYANEDKIQVNPRIHRGLWESYATLVADVQDNGGRATLTELVTPSCTSISRRTPARRSDYSTATGRCWRSTPRAERRLAGPAL